MQRRPFHEDQVNTETEINMIYEMTKKAQLGLHYNGIGIKHNIIL